MLSDSDLTASEQLENALQTLKTDPLIKTHKICIIIVTDFQTLLAYDVKTDDTFDVEFAEPNRDYTFFLQLVGLERAKDFSEHHADVKASEKMGRLSDFIKCYNEFDTQDDIHAINIFLTSLFFLLKILEFLIETVLARPYKQRHRWMAQTPMSCLKYLIDQ